VEEDKIGHGGVTTSALAAAIFDGRSSFEREDHREASVTTGNLNSLVGDKFFYAFLRYTQKT